MAARDTLSTISFWVLPTSARPWVVGLVALVAIAGLTLTVGAPNASSRPFRLWVVVAVAYLQLVASSLTTRLDALNSRLLAPLFIPTVVLAFGALSRCQNRRWTRLLEAGYVVSTMAAGAYFAIQHTPT